MPRTSRGIGAHDIVIQHSANGVTLLFCPLHKVRAPEQPLLFA
jgi:hypothetical protein